MKQTILLIIIGFLSNLCYAQVDLNTNKIINYLTINYPYKDTVFENKLMFKDDIIEPIATPTLTLKKGLRVYKTSLTTNIIEYNRLDIAIVIDINDSIKIAYSPTFDDNQDDFNNCFLNIYAENDSTKRKIISEIASVFKQITYKGDIKNISKQETYWIAELWHADLNWRTINVEYINDRIAKVVLVNPKTK